MASFLKAGRIARITQNSAKLNFAIFFIFDFKRQKKSVSRHHRQNTDF